MPHDPDGMSRRDKKALQREIPASVIVGQSEEYVRKFIMAAQKEEASWIKWQAVKPIPDEQAEY
eukprot:37681-Amphidinium_carterae.1